MHDHDLDLVADLSIGLDPGGAARRLVDSCPECAAEFARQVAVRDLLGGTPPAVMTDDERRRVRAAVGKELDRGASVLAFPRRWAAIGSVAAGVLVLVGVGGVLSQLGEGDGAAEFDTIASALGGAPAATAEAATGDAGTMAATEMAPLDGVGRTRSLDLGAVDLQTFVAKLSEQAVLDEQARAAGDTTENTTSITPAPPEQPACVDRVTAPGQTVVTAVVDGTPVVAYLPPGEATFVAFRISDCEPFPLE
jgi:hypothetical protein